MKTRKLVALTAAALLAIPALTAQSTTSAQNCPSEASKANPYMLIGGPGIVTSESATPDQLPAAAQRFLQTYYSRVMVGPINRNVVKDQYNVELGNGVKVTFNNKGQVEDIQSPGDESLYAPAIKAILPEKAYKHLEDAGLLYEVTGIKNAHDKGMRIELLNAMPPEILFDVDGLFVILDY